VVSWCDQICAACRAGEQVLRGAFALASHSRVMSCQLSQLAKGKAAACTAHRPNGASASETISPAIVRFWYFANPGRIKFFWIGKLSKFDRDSLVMRWRILRWSLACGSGTCP